MTEKISARDIIEKLALEAGITKKMASEILHAIPGIIEEGLQKDGEARVKGLGIFRLKPVKEKTGRNPQTGERVTIPPHNKIIFLPEQTFKEYINQPNRLLDYQVLEKPEEIIPKETVPEEIMPEPVPVPEALSPETDYSPTISPSESDYNTLRAGSEIPPKKRIHWIIPFTAAVIILLSLVFYLRNCHTPQDRTQQPTADTQQSATESQQLEVGSWQPAADSQQSAIESPLPDSLPESPLKREPVGGGTSWGQHSTPSTQHSTLVVSDGRHLFKLAREVYGNPFLWVLIYRANPDQITDPDQVITGKEVKIPALEGAPDKLSRNDSLDVSEGYRLVYEYYQTKGDARATDYRNAMENYKPR